MNLFFILARDTKLLTELYESQKLKFSKKFVKRLRFNQRIQVIEKFGEKIVYSRRSLIEEVKNNELEM